MTLALSDQQLRFITACCQPLPPEKRSDFLGRMVADLKMQGCLRHPDDDALERACHKALTGLIHDSAVA